MFAWSFDRLLPSRVAYVHPRLHSPILANLICLIVGILFFWLVYFSGLPWVGTISLVVGNSTTVIIIGFAICVLAGTLTPYLRKDFIERSNINIKIGGIAAITLAGIIALVYMAWSDAMFMTYSPLGTNQPLPLAFSLIVTFSGVPVYYLIRYINKTRGVDVDLLFREIPPT
jgi:amino acid transporter